MCADERVQSRARERASAKCELIESRFPPCDVRVERDSRDLFSWSALCARARAREKPTCVCGEARAQKGIERGRSDFRERAGALRDLRAERERLKNHGMAPLRARENEQTRIDRLKSVFGARANPVAHVARDSTEDARSSSQTDHRLSDLRDKSSISVVHRSVPWAGKCTHYQRCLLASRCSSRRTIFRRGAWVMRAAWICNELDTNSFFSEKCLLSSYTARRFFRVRRRVRAHSQDGRHERRVLARFSACARVQGNHGSRDAAVLLHSQEP